jgi:hemerythrin-like domain-containing protein
MSTAGSPRSISAMTEDELGGRGSVLVRQRRDHARLDELLDRVEATRGDERDEALTRMCRLAFPHAFAEEAVLWPAARKVLPDAAELTLEVEQEHQEINEILAAVERSKAGDEGREELIARAVELLRTDVRDEEDELLPRMRDALDDRQLRRLGVTWEAVRRISPTRSHPTVARRPPGNVLSALPLSAIDRSRDGLDRGARRAPEPLASAARHASGGLAALAGLVERLPPMRRGEDPSTHSGRTELEN